MTAAQGGGPAARRAASRFRPSVAALVVLVAGLLITAALSALTYVLDNRNESRLLALETKQAGTVLQVILPVVQTPLASATAVATTNKGDAADFVSYARDYVGAAPSPFASMSLWRRSAGSLQMVTSVGRAVASAADVEHFLDRSARVRGVNITDPIGTVAHGRLGYTYSSGRSAEYSVYAESLLPPNRRVAVDPKSAFQDLRFALYLGNGRNDATLLEANTNALPITGRASTVTVPFGATPLTLVAAPQRHLGGGLSGALWWVLAIGGAMISVGAAATAERLVRRRSDAELLTAEVRELLSRQRGIAETLQHALLPQRLPDVAGVDLSVRYIPGEHGVDIGGDWYDVVPLGPDHLFVVVGDVSGRGVIAGSVMASLRFAARGFVSEGHQPAAVLERLARLLDVQADGRFATMLCGVVDVPRREVTLASAGHVPPVLVGGEGPEFVTVPVGPPIGVHTGVGYRAVTVAVPEGGALLAYTDGLVERHDETIDDGFERLRAAAAGPRASADAFLDRVVSAMVHDSVDDTALLVVQWPPARPVVRESASAATGTV